jgi:hypothetical protein
VSAVKTIRFVLATALARVTLSAMTVPTRVLSSPAYPQKGKACYTGGCHSVTFLAVQKMFT